MTLTISYVVYIKSNGEINNFDSYHAEYSPAEGTTSDGYTIKHMTLSQVEALSKDTATFCEEYWLKNNTWTKRSIKKNTFYNWNTSTESWDLNNTALLGSIRSDRDSRLYASDWTQVTDNALSDSKRGEWKTYRQQLRDFMASLPSDIDDLDDVTWPTEPT